MPPVARAAPVPMKALIPKRLLVVAAVVSVVVSVLALERYRGLLPLRRWQRERRAAGEKLTVAELQPAPLSGSQTRLLAPGEIQGRLAAFATSYSLPSAMGYVASGKARLISLSEGWTDWSNRTNNWAGLAKRFEALQEPLEGLRADLRARTFMPRLTYEPTATLAHLNAYRTTAQVLAAAALLDLHDQRLDAALENLLALRALEGLTKREFTLVSQMARCTVAQIALNVFWEALQTPCWTDAQLARLQEACAPGDCLDDLVAALRMERAMGDVSFDRMRISLKEKRRLIPPPSAYASGSSGLAGSLTTIVGSLMYATERFRAAFHGWLWQVAWSYQDQLRFDRRLESGIAAAAQVARRQASLPEALRLATASRPPDSPNQYNRLRFQGTASMLPRLGTVLPRVTVTEARRQLTFVAAALLRYRLRFGHAPASLEALVPEFLPELPRDYCDDQVLRYRLQSDGAFLLYSVGADGRDDGGQRAADFDAWETSFSGRDLLWPQVATEEDIRTATRRR